MGTSKRLLVSFSGGRTSAYMAAMLWHNRSPDDEILVVFANTGQEHDDTLRFVNDVSRRFGFPVTWVEAVVDPRKGKGTGHRVVDFFTATRWTNPDGPFASVASKYGIPNNTFPVCTRELKMRPIHSYVRSIGWKTGSYTTAIGIRVDEIDRMSVNAKSDGIIYPLIKWGVRKSDVLEFFSASHSDIDLRIPEHLGNCTWCWKKSFKKLSEIGKTHPEYFRFPAQLEARFGHIGPEELKGPDGSGRRMFRGARRVAEVLNMSEIVADLAPPNSCEESCEVDFTDQSSNDRLDLFGEPF